MNMVKCLIFALVLLAAGTAFAIPQTYQVYVNTAAIAGQSGYLDFQFNPGNNAQAAFAEVMNFSSSGGSLSGSPVTAGTVNGNLPGTVTIVNTGAWDDYFEGFTFGNQIHFSVRLDGPALTSPDGTAGGGSDFAFSMFAADQVTPLLTNDPNGFAMTAKVMTDGTTEAYYGPSTSPVPEPSTFALLGLGLAGAAVLRKKSRKQ